MHTLYLASGSPRRREILENLRFKVIRIPIDIDETPHSDEKAADYVQRMAQEKNAAAVEQWLATHDASPESDSDRRHYGHLSKPHSRQTGNRSPSSRNTRTAFRADTSGADCRMRILARENARCFTNQRCTFQNLVCRRNIRLYPKWRTDGQSGRVWHSGFGRCVCRAFARQLYRRDGAARLRNGRLVGTIRIEYSPICLILNTFKQTS